MNLNMSFGIFKTLFLVSNVKIRHLIKIREICQASWTLFKKKTQIADLLREIDKNETKNTKK